MHHLRSSIAVALLALSIVLITISCSWWSSSGKGAVESGGKTALTCALSDVEHYAGDVKSDLALADYEAQLSKFKADHNFTQDAVNCMIDAVLQVVTSGVAGALTGETSPMVLNGRAYLAAHASKS